MTALTESEILDCFKTNLRLAVDHCEQLVILPARGPTYTKLREELKLMEGCCRQMAAWRGDARWLPIGIAMEMVHQKSQHWLRYHHPRKLFLKLAENLRGLLHLAEVTETKATGVLGRPILPVVQAGPLRQGRPVQVRSLKEPLVKRRSGLLVPAHYSSV